MIEGRLATEVGADDNEEIIYMRTDRSLLDHEERKEEKEDLKEAMNL